MAVWIVLASASLAYLALFAQNPDAQRHVIARIQTEITGAAPESLAGRTPTPAAKPELNDKVRALNEELETLRRKLKQAQETPPVVPAKAADARDPSGTAGEPSNPAAENTTPETNPETSSMTTASIPRAESPNPATATPEPFNPFATNDSVVVVDDVRPVQEATEPPAQSAENSIPAATPPRRNLNGQNFAIRPLRPGSVPPIPTRQDGRTASAAPAPINRTTSSARSASNFVQPTVLNADRKPARAEPAAVRPRTVARAPTPQPTNASFGAATVTPAPQASALVLSSASSVTGLRASWLVLTTSHARALGGLQPRYVTDPATGTHRLLAGPVSNRAEADRLCSDLIGQGVRCGVTAYAGTPF